MLRGSDSVAQLFQLLCPLFHPVVTVLSKRVRECTHYKHDGVGGHQLYVGLTQTHCNCCAPHIVFKVKIRIYEGV